MEDIRGKADMPEEKLENMENKITADSEEGIQEDIYAEPVIEIQAEEQPESVLEQAEDGTWRHAEDSPFSPFYVPDRKQAKNNRITIALVALLLLLLLAGLIFAVSKLVEAAVGEAKAVFEDGSNAWDSFVSEFKDEFADEWEEDLEEEFGEDFADEYDYDEFMDESDIYYASPEDEYYLKITDSIRDDLSYSVDFETYQVSDAQSNVNIWVRYVEIEGDAPYVDEINENLKDGAMFYAEKFNDLYATDLALSVLSYVTYMDEELLSVVVDERYSFEGTTKYNLYCMNFDLTTGTYLYNTDVIEVTDELVDVFRKQSEYQNGPNEAVDRFSNEELKEFMNSEDTLVLFYSPVGLEIGYVYPDGWITATFKDYEKYLKSL